MIEFLRLSDAHKQQVLVLKFCFGGPNESRHIDMRKKYAWLTCMMVRVLELPVETNCNFERLFRCTCHWLTGVTVAFLSVCFVFSSRRGLLVPMAPSAGSAPRESSCPCTLCCATTTNLHRRQWNRLSKVTMKWQPLDWVCSSRANQGLMGLLTCNVFGEGHWL